MLYIISTDSLPNILTVIPCTVVLDRTVWRGAAVPASNFLPTTLARTDALQNISTNNTLADDLIGYVQAIMFIQYLRLLLLKTPLYLTLIFYGLRVEVMCA